MFPKRRFNHRHSPAIPGQEETMRGRNAAVAVIALLGSCLLLSGCGGTSTLKLGYKPSEGEKGLLASLPSKTVKVLPFSDKRQPQMESIKIGSREAAFAVPMGEVYAERPVFEIVRDAVQTEFARNGHLVVGDNESVSIRGEIRAFSVGTSVTLVYWDVIGNVSFTLEAKKAGDAPAVTMGPFEGKQVERTYVYPTAEIMERVTGGALDNAVRKMGSDAALIAFLKGE
jgi:hypothetical protein